VAVALIPGGVSSSAQDQLRQRLLYGYDKEVHPHNDVRLLYQIIYMECPVPDPDTGMLVSKIHETQVRLSALCRLINQSLLRQKAAHAETHNKNKHKLQTKLTAMK